MSKVPSKPKKHPENKNAPEKRPDAGLYAVATPIGNLKDITLRALEILAAADTIYCEDKRVTQKLLNAYNIKTPLLLYHDHNADKKRPEILERLAAGEVIALVSDAGTPGISDPGFKLFREIRAAGHALYPVPGASAILAGLVGSGLPTDSFYFAGFMPPKSAARKSKFLSLEKYETTLVFYETANRLRDFMEDLYAVMGNRNIVLAREMTKKFEEFISGSTEDIISILDKKTYKGEFVVMVAAPDPKEAEERKFPDEVLDKMLGRALGEMGMSVRDASSYVSEETGVQKRKLYARALALSHAGRSDVSF